MTKRSATTPRSGRRQGNAPTMSDVAKAANCSPMTVSRVINGYSNVRAETREAVEKAIEALHYAPNSAARSLAGANPIRIGLLYSNPSAAYLSEFLVGSLDQASRSDVQLVVEKCEFGMDEKHVIQHFLTTGIDGLILTSPLCDEQWILDMLAAAGMPTVAVGPGKPQDSVSAVCIEEHQAALDMTNYIVGRGHRRIGFVIGNPNQTASERRLEGYCQALREANIEFAPELLVQGQFTYRSGLDAANRLLDLADPPTAIFASNDDMAAAVIAVAHRRHLDVPADLTVCGFDDTFIASTIWPELTTIRQPIAEMSRAAVELLVSELRATMAGTVPEKTIMMLEHSLIRRQSDAAPALVRAAIGAAALHPGP